MDSSAHLATARKLLREEPTAVDLRKAASAAYYALFHHVCVEFSTIVLRPESQEFTRAELQAYRYLDHGSAKQRCVDTRDPGRNFPVGVRTFANAFVALQRQRLDADYDPRNLLNDVIVLELIEQAEAAIAAFDAEPEEARRAFAVFVALKPKNRA
jgi:hypothetical protein